MTESCSASSYPASVSDWEGEEAGCEIEAAEVLASLAESVVDRQNDGEEGVSVEGWARKGKRCGSNKRAKESLIGDSTLDSVIVKSVPMNFDLNEDQAEACEQESEKVGSNENDGAELMARVEGHSSDPSPAEGGLVCSRSYRGGKSRRALTEAEKEARRLRRVLANRESARQTIRRRQTLYEELTKKATTLALENESLKRERETAVKEYQSLQLANKNLTEQMERTLGTPKAESRHQAMAMLGNAGLPFVSSQNSSPFCFCNDETTLVAPYVWPSSIQFPNLTPAQLGQHGIIAISPTLVTPGSSGINSHEGSSSSTTSNVSQNAPPPPSFMMSCPLVVPVPHDGKSSSPHPVSTFLLKDNQETQINFLDHENYSAASANTSSKGGPSLENHLCFSTMDVRREAIALAESHSQQPGTYNYSAVPIGFSFNGQCLPSVSQPNSRNTGSAQVCCDRINTGSEAIKDVSIHQASGLVSEVVVPASCGDGKFPTVVQEIKGVGVICNNPTGMKMVDSAAAAAARKRRKELTDMKNLHCRPHRKPCFG